MRVIFFSQKIDTADWLQRFTVDWVCALAREVTHLDVIALEYRPHPTDQFPANLTIHSLGKEHGASRATQLLNFQRTLARLLPGATVCVGHLTPRYTWLAAPLAALHRVPQCLWYTHQHTGPELHLALSMCRWIVTATSNSFPIASPKVHTFGHGIAAERFTPSDSLPDPDADPLILAVGRIAPIKHHHILIDAAAHLRDQGLRLQVAIAGGSATPEGERYLAELTAQVDRLRLTDRVTFLGGLNGKQLLAQLRRAQIVTNLSPVGLFDKAALEAMMVGCPVLVTNPAFDELLGEYRDQLSAPAPDATLVIAEKLAGLLRLSPEQRIAIGHELRERTLAAHSLDRLMKRLVDLWSHP